MNASCERVKSAAASETNFVVEMTDEDFVNMTFEMAASLTNLDAEVFRMFHGATTVLPGIGVFVFGFYVRFFTSVFGFRVKTELRARGRRH